MVKPLRSTDLVVWCLAAFHTFFLFVALVVLLYAGGALGGLLGSLSTLVGVALFALLWATTWWSTHRGVAALKKEGELPVPSFWEFIGVGAKWGAVNGELFFLLLVSVYIVIVLVTSLISSAFEVVGLVAFVACVGVVIAPLIGGLAGIVLAVIDAGVAWLASRIYVSLVLPHATAELD